NKAESIPGPPGPPLIGWAACLPIICAAYIHNAIPSASSPAITLRGLTAALLLGATGQGRQTDRQPRMPLGYPAGAVRSFNGGWATLLLLMATLPAALSVWKDKNWNDQLDDWWHYRTGIIGGPEQWGRKAYMTYNLWQICHRGRHQSPINISTANLVYDSNLGPLTLTGADEAISLSVRNTGHDIEIRLGSERLVLSQGPLSYSYTIFGALIKFGSRSDRGSDHWIDSRAFPGELQFYGYNSDLYENYTMALNSAHGIVALSAFMQFGDVTTVDMNPDGYQANYQRTEIHGIKVRSLLPETSEYITYEGSLPFPGCHESVTWIILNLPVTVRTEELSILRSLRISSVQTSAYMADNFRPTQLLHQRTVRTNIRLRNRLKDEPRCQSLESVRSQEVRSLKKICSGLSDLHQLTKTFLEY
uniref:Alpha-carbonic anhydrase domain-containing protein n=1 Tax=Macrostomum lignano TaxID=282301 RepID=A0A1I8GK63_9PLAT